MFYKGNILYKGNIQSVKEELLDDLIAETEGGGGGGYNRSVGRYSIGNLPENRTRRWKIVEKNEEN